MKQCPNCQKEYSDDTLRFCLQDGTPLIVPAATEAETPTVVFTDSETLVSPRQVERMDIPVVKAESQNWQQTSQSQTYDTEPVVKKSKVLPAVLLTAFVMFLLFGGAIGTWLYLNKNQTETAKTNVNKALVNHKTPPKENVNAEVIKSPEEDTPSPSPSATPKDSPTATPPANFNPEQVKREVSEKIDAWKKAAESVNLNGYMNYYADKIDYYNKKGASLATVRSDKQKAFGKFDYIKVDISNLRVTPDTSGERATAIFDKEWNFEGDNSYSAGKVQTQLQLKKFEGRWLITGERDLKVYYTE